MAAVAVDLSKAFDSVCHSLLLAKLKAYRLSDEAISLMCSYLHGRKQRVNGSFSNLLHLPTPLVHLRRLPERCPC